MEQMIAKSSKPTSVTLYVYTDDPHSITQPHYRVCTLSPDGVGRGIGEFKSRKLALKCLFEVAKNNNIPADRIHESEQ